MPTKKLFAVLLFAALSSTAQKNSFEISTAILQERSLNREIPSVARFNAVPTVINRFGGLFSITHAYAFHQHISLISTLRLVSRQIEYNYYSTPIKQFSYNVAELPLGLRFNKALPNNHKLLFDVCPGLNMVLTQDKLTQAYVTSDKSVTAARSSNFEMLSSTKLNYFLALRLHLLSKATEHSAFSVYLGYQQQFTPLFRYVSLGPMVGEWGNPLKTHYASFGLSYVFEGKK